MGAERNLVSTPPVAPYPWKFFPKATELGGVCFRREAIFLEMRWFDARERARIFFQTTELSWQSYEK